MLVVEKRLRRLLPARPAHCVESWGRARKSIRLQESDWILTGLRNIGYFYFVPPE